MAWAFAPAAPSRVARRIAAISCVTALLLIGLSACGGVPVTAPSAAADGPAMATGAIVAPPAGLPGFCARHPDDCAPVPPAPGAVGLSAARWRELQTVQAEVNRTIRPREIPGHAWDYPSGGYGECNEYALEKRRELTALGWPPEALLLAAAYTETGEGHLVLVARTSGGDLVLDNRRAAVVAWGDLPYRWVSRQSESSLATWVRII